MIRLERPALTVLGRSEAAITTLSRASRACHCRVRPHAGGPADGGTTRGRAGGGNGAGGTMCNFPSSRSSPARRRPAAAALARARQRLPWYEYLSIIG